jgi:hypothetical protein
VILRYANGAWAPIPTPPVAPTTEIFAFSAVSADEAWAIGTTYGPGPLQTIFAHFAQGAWTIAPQTFTGVTEQLVMLSPTDGWAFDRGNGDGGMLLHYDGAAWAQASAPPSGIGQFDGTAFAVAPGTDWLGVALDDGAGIAQYANGQWQRVAWPYAEVIPVRIAAVSSAELWGVGNIVRVAAGCRPGMPSVFLHFQHGIWTLEQNAERWDWHAVNQLCLTQRHAPPACPTFCKFALARLSNEALLFATVLPSLAIDAVDVLLGTTSARRADPGCTGLDRRLAISHRETTGIPRISHIRTTYSPAGEETPSHVELRGRVTGRAPQHPSRGQPARRADRLASRRAASMPRSGQRQKGERRRTAGHLAGRSFSIRRFAALLPHLLRVYS